MTDNAERDMAEGALPDPSDRLWSSFANGAGDGGPEPFEATDYRTPSARSRAALRAALDPLLDDAAAPVRVIAGRFAMGDVLQYAVAAHFKGVDVFTLPKGGLELLDDAAGTVSRLGPERTNPAILVQELDVGAAPSLRKLCGLFATGGEASALLAAQGLRLVIVSTVANQRQSQEEGIVRLDWRDDFPAILCAVAGEGEESGEILATVLREELEEAQVPERRVRALLNSLEADFDAADTPGKLPPATPDDFRDWLRGRLRDLDEKEKSVHEDAAPLLSYVRAAADHPLEVAALAMSFLAPSMSREDYRTIGPWILGDDQISAVRIVDVVETGADGSEVVRREERSFTVPARDRWVRDLDQILRRVNLRYRLDEWKRRVVVPDYSVLGEEVNKELRSSYPGVVTNAANALYHSAGFWADEFNPNAVSMIAAAAEFDQDGFAQRTVGDLVGVEHWVWRRYSSDGLPGEQALAYGFLIAGRLGRVLSAIAQRDGGLAKRLSHRLCTRRLMAESPSKDGDVHAFHRLVVGVAVIDAGLRSGSGWATAGRNLLNDPVAWVGRSAQMYLQQSLLGDVVQDEGDTQVAAEDAAAAQEQTAEAAEGESPAGNAPGDALGDAPASASGGPTVRNSLRATLAIADTLGTLASEGWEGRPREATLASGTILLRWLAWQFRGGNAGAGADPGTGTGQGTGTADLASCLVQRHQGADQARRLAFGVSALNGRAAYLSGIRLDILGNDLMRFVFAQTAPGGEPLRATKRRLRRDLLAAALSTYPDRSLIDPGVRVVDELGRIERGIAVEAMERRGDFREHCIDLRIGLLALARTRAPHMVKDVGPHYAPMMEWLIGLVPAAALAHWIFDATGLDVDRDGADQDVLRSVGRCLDLLHEASDASGARYPLFRKWQALVPLFDAAARAMKADGAIRDAPMLAQLAMMEKKRTKLSALAAGLARRMQEQQA